MTKTKRLNSTFSRQNRRCSKGGKAKSEFDYDCRRLRRYCGNTWYFYKSEDLTEEDKKFIDGLVEITIAATIARCVPELTALMMGDLP